MNLFSPPTPTDARPKTPRTIYKSPASKPQPQNPATAQPGDPDAARCSAEPAQEYGHCYAHSTAPARKAHNPSIQWLQRPRLPYTYLCATLSLSPEPRTEKPRDASRQTAEETPAGKPQTHRSLAVGTA